jgi:hypothetical protein
VGEEFYRAEGADSTAPVPGRGGKKNTPGCRFGPASFVAIMEGRGAKPWMTPALFEEES